MFPVPRPAVCRDVAQSSPRGPPHTPGRDYQEPYVAADGTHVGSFHSQFVSHPRPSRPFVPHSTNRRTVPRHGAVQPPVQAQQWADGPTTMGNWRKKVPLHGPALYRYDGYPSDLWSDAPKDAPNDTLLGRQLTQLPQSATEATPRTTQPSAAGHDAPCTVPFCQAPHLRHPDELVRPRPHFWVPADKGSLLAFGSYFYFYPALLLLSPSSSCCSRSSRSLCVVNWGVSDLTVLPSSPLLLCRNARIMASPIASNALKARIRNPALLKKLARPEDLMHHFPNGAYIGWSGFTGVGYPKYVCPSLPCSACFAPTATCTIIILAYCRFRASPHRRPAFPQSRASSVLFPLHQPKRQKLLAFALTRARHDVRKVADMRFPQLQEGPLRHGRLCRGQQPPEQAQVLALRRRFLRRRD